MRKLLRITATFALALVFSAGVAFAQQNEAITEQNGNSNDVTVTQDGSDHVTEVYQGQAEELNLNPGTATNNVAIIDQLSGKNGSQITQAVDGGTALNNVAKIFQNGQGNGTDVSGDLNRKTGIVQGFNGGVAEDNMAVIDQNGDDNESDIDQGQDGGIAKDNTAEIHQDGNDNGPVGSPFRQGFGSSIVQAKTPGAEAYNNTAKGDQVGTGNGFLISQGYRNQSGSVGGVARNNEAYIEQIGTGNGSTAQFPNFSFYTYISQGMDGSLSKGNDADVLQNGVENTGAIEQGIFGYDAIDNQALIDQDGRMNAAIISQGWKNSAEDNEAEVIQDGDFQEATVYQHGQNNEATLTQDGFPEGSDNVSRLDQTNGSEADVDQYGDNNYFSGDGPRNTFASQDNSILTLDQIGDENWTGVDQTDSEATITQDGTKNKTMLTQSNSSDATVTQEGNGPYNVARLTQDDGDLTLTQEGNNNTTRLVQTSSDATITQDGFRTEVRLNQDNSSTATVTQEGTNHKLFGLGGPSFAAQDNSTLTLTQTGDRNRAYVDQTGSTATVTQNGTNNTATVNQQP